MKLLDIAHGWDVDAGPDLFAFIELGLPPSIQAEAPLTSFGRHRLPFLLASNTETYAIDLP